VYFAGKSSDTSEVPTTAVKTTLKTGRSRPEFQNSGRRGYSKLANAPFNDPKFVRLLQSGQAVRVTYSLDNPSPKGVEKGPVVSHSLDI
jgi:hypothetical protein